MGSGSTGIACLGLNRNFVGYELNPDYYAIAEKRFQQYDATLFTRKDLFGTML